MNTKAVFNADDFWEINQEILRNYSEQNNLDFETVLKDCIKSRRKTAEVYNDYSPAKNGYTCTVIDSNPNTKDEMYNDSVDNLLNYAEYVLNTFNSPLEPLSKISAKLYEYKHMFNNSMLYLHTMDTYSIIVAELTQLFNN